MQARELKDHAADLFRKGKFAKAAEAYAQLAQLEPNDGQVLIKLGDSHRRGGARSAAIEAYRRAVDRYAQDGILIKAIAACKLILEIDPTQKEAQEALASLYGKRYLGRSEVPMPRRTVAERVEEPFEIDLPEDSGELTLEPDRMLPIAEAPRPPTAPRPKPVPPGVEGSRAAPPNIARAVLVDQPQVVSPSGSGVGKGPAPAPVEVEVEMEDDAAAWIIPVAEEVDESDEEIIEGELIDLEPADEVIAENTAQHALLQEVERAAERRTPTMANVLGDSAAARRSAVGSPKGTAPAVRPPPPPPPGSDVAQERVPLFSGLPRAAFVDLLEQTDFHRADSGDVILREGDEGRSIFVLATGRAKVVKGHGTQAAVELAELSEGEFFGEMALLNGAPRVASVVANEECELLEIRETVLTELAQRHPEVAQSLKRFYRQRLLANVMAISPLFRAFDGENQRALIERFKLRVVPEDNVLIREGEKPTGLFVVVHGIALVTKKDVAKGRVTPVAVLKEGDVFGEMSLLTKKAATATVITKRRSLVLHLAKAAFDELIFTHPAVLELVSQLTDERTRVNEQILAGNVPIPHDALALL